jgi:hypothetical protein
MIDQLKQARRPDFRRSEATGWIEIHRVISELSEQAYSADWMREAEYDVWRLITEGGSWGHLTSEEVEPQLRRLLRLAASSGCWVIQYKPWAKSDQYPFPGGTVDTGHGAIA